MNFITYLPLFILIYVSLKLLLKFIEENIISLKEQITEDKIDKGIISIKDLQKNNYDRFLKYIKLYLSTHSYENIIIFKDNSPELTNLKGVLNNENIYISCIQNDIIIDDNKEDNLNLTIKSDIQMFLGRMVKNDCNKGILINNSSFSEDAKEFARSFNSSSNKEIKLIDGYELTKSIRIYKNCNTKLEVSNEF